MLPIHKLSKAVLLSALLAGQAAAGVTIKKETVDGATVYRLQNYRVNLVVSPAQGGAVTSYKDKLGGNVELIHQRPRNGLCMDHFQAQPWPGELLDAPYKIEAVQQKDSQCTIRLSIIAKGLWRGAQYPKLKGLRLDKTYTLAADSPALRCDVRITAPGKSSKLFGYWTQNVFFAGGRFDLDSDVSFRPCARGVRVKSATKAGHFGREDFLSDFSDGWMALVDTKAKNGLVVLADYDDLKFQYVCAGNRTVEPMFQIAYLPPSASRTYTVHIVPVVGLDNVVAATADYVAGYQMQSDNKGSGSVELAVVRSVRAPKRLSLELSVMNVENRKLTANAGALVFSKLSDRPQLKKATFSGAGSDPLVLKATATAALADGKKATHVWEQYHNGAYKWGENIRTDMATPYYIGLRPPQKLKLHKPKSLRLLKPYQWRVWYAEGKLDDYYNVASAVRLVTTYRGDSTLRKRAFVSHSSFGTKLSAFPYDYEELLGYNYIVFGGVKKDALGDIGIEMLCDYLSAGGGMIVLGGPSAYGPSRLAGSKLESLWPVKLRDTNFDLKDVAGKPLEVADPSVAFLMDLDFSAKPRVRYVHDVEVKPGATVVLKAGGRPFLVIGEAGPKKARVACILGAPMGTVGEGTPFWAWKDWPYLLRQIVWWSTKRDEYLRPF